MPLCANVYDFLKADCFTSGTLYSGEPTTVPNSLHTTLQIAAEAVKSAAGVASQKASATASAATQKASEVGNAASQKASEAANSASANANYAANRASAETSHAANRAAAETDSATNQASREGAKLAEDLKGKATDASYTADQVTSEIGKKVNQGQCRGFIL